jgi:hypothetical protein
MALQQLNHAQAFSPGSDLWVLHDDAANPVLSKLDWYLNFQITRARNHQPKDLAPNLRAVLTENAIPSNENKADKNQPLLIRAGAQLPTHFVMIVPAKDLKKWSETVHEKWLHMQKPKLRIFLPLKMSLEQFGQNWTKDELSELSVV